MAESRDDNRSGTSGVRQGEPGADPPVPMEGAVGASDGTSGGGAGAGIPDGNLAQRAGDTVTRGDAREDREKIFPEAAEPAPPGSEEDRV